jgi:hypothetical protein
MLLGMTDSLVWLTGQIGWRRGLTCSPETQPI